MEKLVLFNEALDHEREFSKIVNKLDLTEEQRELFSMSQIAIVKLGLSIAKEGFGGEDGLKEILDLLK